MKSVPAISVKNLSKQYVLGSEVLEGQSFREMLIGLFKAPLKRIRRLQGKDIQQEKFWALRDISFEIQRGDVVGIIGRNGAGKSTLLKVLSRITTPTEGTVSYQGRVASLLEVGTGFHPELTGKENIYLNGAILGMTRKEIGKQMDEIVSFAGIERFLETPVKRYSSGMYVRLAFSVAAHLEPDILIVDEILSVGDAKFQNKCIGKMSEVASAGRTVIFVSHNLNAVRKLCNQVKVIEDGQLKFEGGVDEGMTFYENSIGTHFESIEEANYKGNLAGTVQFSGIRYIQQDIEVQTIDVNQDFVIELTGSCVSKVENIDLCLQVFRDGVHITALYDTQTLSDLNEGGFRSIFSVSAHSLTPGRYTLGIGANDDSSNWVWGEEVAILNTSGTQNHMGIERNLGMVSVQYRGERVEIS